MNLNYEMSEMPCTNYIIKSFIIKNKVIINFIESIILLIILLKEKKGKQVKGYKAISYNISEREPESLKMCCVPKKSFGH